MKEALIDTDILSYYFRGDATVTNRLATYLDYFDRLNISIITHFEILSGLLINDSRNQLRKFKEFCITNTIVNTTISSVAISSQIVAHLQKKGMLIDNQDILIAGIALENNLVLVTNNENHFARIPNLMIENWKKYE
jgi:tRNA(fMet)-specific endonuclease VapC